ncbi:hypothetical protein ACIA71_26885 [Streptomyces anulatus]
MTDHAQAYVGEFVGVVEGAEEGCSGGKGEGGGGAVADEGGGVGVVVGGGAGVGKDGAGVGDDEFVDLDALGVDAEVERAAGLGAGWGRRAAGWGATDGTSLGSSGVRTVIGRTDEQGVGMDVVIGRPVVVRAEYRVSAGELVEDLKRRYGEEVKLASWTRMLDNTGPRSGSGRRTPESWC